MRRPKYRLSPNEVERLVKEDREQRRKLRLVQVREQAKANAAAIRNDVRREKERLLKNFTNEVKEQLEAEKEEKLRKLEQKYENTLRTIGEGHREAHIHGDGENRAEKLQKQRENEAAAEARYKEALERQRKEDAEKEYEQNKHILARQAVLQKERERAAEIASLPPPPPDISVELEKIKKRAIPMVDMKAFATTHYHIPEYHVVRADSQEQLYDAKIDAEDSDLKLKQDLAEKKRSQHERIERARIRGNEALQKEMLKHDYGDMLKDLSLLQKQDRRRRQGALSEIPKQVFIPPERCLEERQERQQEMERKFDEIYMQQYRLESEPLRSFDVSDYPTTQDSMDASGQDSSTTPDVPIPLSRINPALRDLTNVPKQGEVAQVKKPETVLKQLLNRIKEQRDTSTNQKASSAASTIPRSLSEFDSQSQLSAGSRADWQKAEDGGQSGVWSRPDGSHTQATSETQDDRTTVTATATVDDGQSDLDPAVISRNEEMIEELRKRIELIEAQKRELADQFKAQSSFHRGLMLDNFGQTSLHRDDSTTLREVDIDESRDTETDRGMERTRESDIHVKVFPSDNQSPSVDLATAASNLKPVTGILKGVRNTQYELLTSNGFLPAPEMMSNRSHVTDGGPASSRSGDGWSNNVSRSEGLEPAGMQNRAVGSLDTDAYRSNPQSQLDAMRAMYMAGGRGDGAGVGLGVGARREINFGVEPSETLPRFIGAGDTMPNFDGGDSGWFSGQAVSVVPAQHQKPGFVSFGSNFPSLGGAIGAGSGDYFQGQMGGFSQGLGEGYRQAQGISFSSTSPQDEMARRLKEYREKAEERGASLDIETIRKAREYQQKLIETHEERKKLLSDVRADIERRRQELQVSATKTFRPASDVAVQGLPEHSLLEAWGRSRGELGTSDMVRPSDTWKPVSPFIADQGRTMTGSSGPSQMYQESSTPGLVAPVDRGYTGGEKTTGGQGGGVDKIRKSLSFEDPDDSMNVSRVSWKDALNDTATSKHSQGRSDDSRLTSSEEDRGSPILPHSRSRSEVSDKSNLSAAGSSSLNGSALVARAEERRMGFERRQEELQHQLMDIQKQKDDILQRYYEGQQALQQQQAMLRSKLASVSADSGDSEKKEQAEIRAKLAEVKSQIEADRGGGVSQGWTAGGDETDESRESIGVSGRPSLGSNSTPGNLSSDSYLADISYHRIKSADYRSLPSSAFQAWAPSAISNVPLPRRSDDDQSGAKMQTWASLLSSSSQDKQRGQEASLASQHHSIGLSLSGLEEGSSFDSNGQGSSGSHARGARGAYSFEDTKSSGDKSLSSDESLDNPEFSQLPRHTPPPLSAHGAALSLADHKPHELSTILEVDTPTSSSALGSVKITSRVVTGSAAPTISSQSLSSQASSTETLSGKPGSDSKMDVFKDLPYTFPEGKAASLGSSGAVYDLSAGQRREFGSLEDASRAKSNTSPTVGSGSRTGEQVQMKAKRSLDFSEQERDYSGQERQRYTETAPLSSEEDIFATAMPILVEHTPCKTGSSQDQGGDRESYGQDSASAEDWTSLKISGYSDYLRQLEDDSNGDMSDRRIEDRFETSEPSGAATDLRSELLAAVGNRESDIPGGFGSREHQTQQISEALQHAEEFGPDLMGRLRQQSRAVFSDVSGEGDTTGLSGVSGGQGQVSGTSELEEVSLWETTGGTEEDE